MNYVDGLGRDVCEHGVPLATFCHTCAGTELRNPGDAEGDETPREHFHVTDFVAGCLNDSDSAYETLEDARAALLESVEVYRRHGYTVESAGEDRYEWGNVHILSIDPCNQADCWNDDGTLADIW